MQHLRPLMKGIWNRSASTTLLLGVLFALAFLFNFFWEAFHSVYLYKHHNFMALRYFRMLVYVSSIDALFIGIDYIGVATIFRDLRWVRRSWGPAYVVFVVIGVLTAAAVEIRAVYFLHRWQYGPEMPTIFGIGVSPLVQLGLTGLISAWLVGALFFRRGFFQED